MTLALVACVKTKQSEPAPAEQLYTSPWFKKARRYGIQESDTCRILSAEHGLLHPETKIHPYETTLYDFSADQRREWASSALESLNPLLRIHDEVLILAGKRYREYVVDPLRENGVTVHIPMEGLGLGEQLCYLNEQLDG